MGYVSSEVISMDALLVIPKGTLYHFGVLTSAVHNAWMRVVCGRLKSDYRYSKDIVYNNYPWPSPMDEQRAAIEATAQGILDARAKFPDSSLADLYDDRTMPAELRRAHHLNDHAVMAAYGYTKGMDEPAIVADLFQRYQELVK